MSFSPDGKILSSGSVEIFKLSEIKLWNLETFSEIKTLSGHSGGVVSVSFSPDGKTLASGSEDNSIIIWKN